MSDAAKVQSMPVTNPNSRDVLNDLLAAKDFRGPIIDANIAAQLEERVALGVRKYGTRLQSFNDRDVILDIRQELLDGIMYSHQGVMQGFRCAFVRDRLIQMLKDLDDFGESNLVKISLDLDGVLVDFERAAVHMVRAMYVPDLPADYKMQDWSFSEIISEEQFVCVFKRMLSTHSLWTWLKPFHDAVDAVREYIARNGDAGVYFITSRPDCLGGSATSMTGLWLHDQGLPIRNLHVVHSTKEKPPLMAELGIAYSLDDYAPTVTACQHLAGHQAFVLDRPYNQDQPGAIALPRAYSVAEFLLEVEARES